MTVFFQARIRATGARVYLQPNGQWTSSLRTAWRTAPLPFLAFERIVCDAPQALWDVETRRETLFTRLLSSL